MNRQREIVIEIERTRVVACRLQSVSAFCQTCNQNSEFLDPVEAAKLCETDSEKIFTLADIGAAHSLVAENGALLVCLASLLNSSFV